MQRHRDAVSKCNCRLNHNDTRGRSKRNSHLQQALHDGIAPFWSQEGPWGSHVRFRAPKSDNPPFGPAPQAPLRKFQGSESGRSPALAIAIALGAILESGASWRLAAPAPVANPCGLAGPPYVCDVPVQVPGPGRFQHRLPGAQAPAALQLQLVQCRDGTHGSLIYIDVACYAVYTYVHLRIDIESIQLYLPHYHMMHITATFPACPPFPNCKSSICLLVIRHHTDGGRSPQFRLA